MLRTWGKVSILVASLLRFLHNPAGMARPARDRRGRDFHSHERSIITRTCRPVYLNTKWATFDSTSR